MNYLTAGRFFLRACLLSVGLLLCSANAYAEEPVAMLRGVTDRVLAQLRSHQGELKAHPDRIYGIAEHLIVPHVDFEEMGRWIAGRNAWSKSSGAEQSAFISAFRNLVVRTYATSLLQYTDQEIEFMPPKGGSAKERIQVASFIREEGKAPIRIDYRLVQHGGTWMLYDIVIEGVSLLKGYQAQFTDVIRQSGLSAATNKIRHHNNQ